jgi:hypothetical protein
MELEEVAVNDVELTSVRDSGQLRISKSLRKTYDKLEEKEEGESTTTKVLPVSQLRSSRNDKPPPFAWDNLPRDMKYYLMEHFLELPDFLHLRATSKSWLQASQFCSQAQDMNEVIARKRAAAKLEQTRARRLRREGCVRKVKNRPCLWSIVGMAGAIMGIALLVAWLGGGLDIYRSSSLQDQETSCLVDRDPQSGNPIFKTLLRTNCRGYRNVTRRVYSVNGGHAALVSFSSWYGTCPVGWNSSAWEISDSYNYLGVHRQRYDCLHRKKKSFRAKNRTYVFDYYHYNLDNSTLISRSSGDGFLLLNANLNANFTVRLSEPVLFTVFVSMAAGFGLVALTFIFVFCLLTPISNCMR